MNILDNKLVIGISITTAALAGIGYGIYKYFSNKEDTKEEKKTEETHKEEEKKEEPTSPNDE